MSIVAETQAKYGDVLAKGPMFAGLTDSQLHSLAQRAVARNCSPGEMIFGEGDPCSGLYVVERGHVRIFKSSAAGREQVLSIDGRAVRSPKCRSLTAAPIPPRRQR